MKRYGARKTQSKIQKITALVASASILALSLSGCGSSDGGGGSDKTIKIGMITSLTGNASFIGKDNVLGAKQAVSELNKAGGVLGKKLELVIKNDATEPDQAVIAFNSLSSDGIAAVAGPGSSNSALALIPRLARTDIPMISLAASDEQVEKPVDGVYMTSLRSKLVAEQLLRYAKDQGLTKLAVAYDSQNSYSTKGFENVVKFAPQYGIDFVVKEKIATTMTDFTPALTHVRNSDAEGLMVWAIGAAAVTMTKQFDAAKLDVPLLMTTSQASPLFTEPAGAAAEGVIVASSVGVVADRLEDSSEVVKKSLTMAQAYRAKNNVAPSGFALDAYTSIMIIAAAIEEANSADPKKIKEALVNLSVTTPSGAYHYSAKDHNGLKPDDVAIDVVKDGAIVPTQWFLDKQSAQGN